MIKFGTPTIALPLAIKKCTVQTGCTVYTRTSVFNTHALVNVLRMKFKS